MKPEIVVSLMITGFTDRPESISRLLKMEADEVWAEGDLIHEKAILRRKENGWNVQSRSKTCISVGDVLDGHVLTALIALKQNLAKLPSGVEIQLACAIYVYDEVPEINFSKEVVSVLGQIGGSLDIDLYCLGSE